MPSTESIYSIKSYLNPVFRKDFPDPFVWKFCGEYWAICTGFWHDGGVFGVLRSRDLLNWTDCGSAINPLPFAEATCYWAPEVFYENGKFYLYYSVGNEESMEIRVAVAHLPNGKYIDSGHRLTTEQFAIDAHVFADSDGAKYLFYATDFLAHSHIGTGTVRDKMVSPFLLAGDPQPVTRAKFDWQVYDPNRASKGGVRWHTIEGSTVLKRKHLYYQMFSGGNWQNISYGVSYATTRNLAQKEEWQQTANGETVFPILRTIPDKVIGPGHNSVVRGQDNRQLYCVYHCWAKDLSGRQMAIDKLDFAGERMFVLGATFENQFIPNQPFFVDFFDKKPEQGLGFDWESETDEEWLTGAGIAISNPALTNIETSCRFAASSFLVEVSAKAIEYLGDGCGYGFSLKKRTDAVMRCLILPDAKQIEIFEFATSQKLVFDLPADFDPRAFHLWRVEVDNFVVRVQLDEASFSFEKQLALTPDKFALTSQKMSAGFAGFSLTIGFENLFDWDETQSGDGLAARGWQVENNNRESWLKTSPVIWKIQDNFLHSKSVESSTTLLKNLLLTEFELVVNARSISENNFSDLYKVVFRENSSEIIAQLRNDNENHLLCVSNQSSEIQRFLLPANFDPNEFHQLRFRLKNNFLYFYCQNSYLGEIEVDSSKQRQIGIRVGETETVFDMVRLTAI